MREAIIEAGQTDTSAPLSRPLARVAPRYAVVTRACRDILQDALPGKDGIVLKDVADAVADALDRLALHPHLAGAGRLQPANQGRRRPLAAPGRPHSRPELPRRPPGTRATAAAV